MLQHPRHRLGLGVVALHQHPAGVLPAAGAAGDLGEQVKGALGGAEVGQRQRGVGQHHAHQRHAGKVVALGHHLGAHQHVDLSPGERREQVGQLFRGAGGVAVEPGHPRLRKRLGHFGFDALGAHPQRDHRPAAVRTGFGHRRALAAVVAQQPPLRAVLGEADIAVVALERLPAHLAEREGREPAAVEEQNRLLPGGEGLGQRLPQRLREHRRLFLTRHARAGDAQVHQLDPGHRPIVDAAGEVQFLVAATPRVLERLQRRRGRAEHAHRAGALGAHHRQVARVVAQLLFLLERRVVLLVDHHHPEVLHRREHRAAHPHRDGHLAPAQGLPVAQPLGFLQARVQHRHLLPEAALKSTHQLRRQRDLWHQNQRALAPLDRRLDQPQVDLGLAAAGDAVEQVRRERPGLHRLDQRRDRDGLLGGERVGARLAQAFLHLAHDGHLFEAEQPLLLHRLEVVPRVGNGARQLFHRAAASDGQQIREHRVLRGRAMQRDQVGARGRLHPLHRVGPGRLRVLGGGERGRQRRAQRLAQRVAVVLRREAHQLDHVGRQRRLVFEHPLHLLHPRHHLGSGLGGRPEHEAQRTAAAERHANALPGQEPAQQRLGNRVGELAAHRPPDCDLDERAIGEGRGQGSGDLLPLSDRCGVSGP